MKILQVISSFPPAYSYGGPVKVSYDISKELVKNNHDVTVYTTDVYNSHSRLNYKTNPEMIDGIIVYRFRNISNFLSKKNFSFAPMMYFFLKSHIKEFDIIHLHEYRSVQAIFVSHLARKSNIPYIIQAHGSVLPTFEKQWLKKIFDIFWGKKILFEASKCIALTKKEAEYYQIMGVPKKNIVIIPNGVHIEEYKELPNLGNFRMRYDFQKDTKLILYIGRIHQSKGLDLLIDAFNELIQERINCKLIMIGPDDGYLQQIERKINNFRLHEKIIIIGFIPINEKIEALVDSDVFVTPSFSGFPITFLEACACGLPVITSTHGDSLDWIDNNVGFVVEYNLSRLKEAILKIIDDEAVSKKFSNQGKRLVAEQFNWNAICDQIEMNYREVIYQ